MEQLVDAILIVNNEAVGYMPNTLKCTEGLGEQNVRAVSRGGGQTEQVYSQNLESNLGKVMADLPVTPDVIDLVRAWKVNRNRNVVQVVGRTADGKQVARTYTEAALINDYEVAFGSDTTIPVEFHANAPI